MELTYNQIIPDEYQNELIQLGEQVSSSYWRVGDIANICYSEAMKSGLPVTKMDIQAAVGFFFRVSGRTVRYYADVASFYLFGICWKCNSELDDPPESEAAQCAPGHWCWTCEEASCDWREKYSDVLSFQHYAYAMQFRNNDKWKTVLDEAAYGGYEGRPLSVDVVAGKNRPPEPEPPEYFPEVEPIGQRSEKIKEVAVIKAAEEIALALKKMSKNMELPQRVRDMLGAAYTNVEAALLEMATEIDLDPLVKSDSWSEFVL